MYQSENIQLSKWQWKKLRKRIYKNEQEYFNDLELQKTCNHNYWIARCSHCNKVLATDSINNTNQNIREIIENILKEKNIINQIKDNLYKDLGREALEEEIKEELKV